MNRKLLLLIYLTSFGFIAVLLFVGIKIRMTPDLITPTGNIPRCFVSDNLIFTKSFTADFSEEVQCWTQSNDSLYQEIVALDNGTKTDLLLGDIPTRSQKVISEGNSIKKMIIEVRTPSFADTILINITFTGEDCRLLHLNGLCKYLEYDHDRIMQSLRLHNQGKSLD